MDKTVKEAKAEAEPKKLVRKLRTEQYNGPDEWVYWESVGGKWTHFLCVTPLKMEDVMVPGFLDPAGPNNGRVMPVKRYERVRFITESNSPVPIEFETVVVQHFQPVTLQLWTGRLMEYDLPKDSLTCFDVLGINPKTASVENVKEAFLKLSKEYHPDAGGSDIKMKELNKARTEAERIVYALRSRAA